MHVTGLMTRAVVALLALAHAAAGFGGGMGARRTALRSARSVRMAIPTEEMVAMNDFVLVQLDLEPKKTAGGLFLAVKEDQLGDEIEDKYKAGTVIATGPGMTREDGSLVSMKFSKGERVVVPGTTKVGIRIDILAGSLGLVAYRQGEIVGRQDQ